MATEYRQKSCGDTWHFCANCPDYPLDNFVSDDSPATGELCNECVSMKWRGVCE